MAKRVYKFLSAHYGINNLENRRVKVATLDDLNDPFDLVSIDTTDPALEKALELMSAQFSTRNGLLCFSRNWDNLLMWSHYGASHTGICLGIDIPEENGGYDMEVRYQPDVLRIRHPRDVNFDLANRLLRTKHECWSYEQESRVFVQLNDPADAAGLHWFPFGEHLQLKEVIVGAQCEPKDLKAISEIMKTYSGVECSWAYMGGVKCFV